MGPSESNISGEKLDRRNFLKSSIGAGIVSGTGVGSRDFLNRDKYGLDEDSFASDPPGVEWEGRYFGNKDGKFTSVISVSDGYVLGGRTGSDAWITKVDNTGKKEWDVVYQDSFERYSINTITEVEDGYVFGGGPERLYSADTGALAGKVDKDGNREWKKIIGSGNSQIYSIDSDKDGYIFGGALRPYNADNKGSWLLKLDGEGNELWSKSYTGDWIKTVVSTDKGYIFVGDLRSKEKQIDVMMVDKSGGEKWSEEYDEFSGGWIESIIEIDDGYILMDNVSNILKINQKREKQWFKEQTDDLDAHSITEVQDGYVMAGVREGHLGESYPLAEIVKINTEGKLEWRKKHNEEGEDYAYSVDSDDDGFVFAGFTNSFNDDGFDGWLMKYNKKDEKDWSKLYNGPESLDDEIRDVISVEDGFVFVGDASNFDLTSNGIWVVKTDDKGKEVWEKRFTGNWAKSVIQTDGGYLLAGGDDNGVKLMKIASDGEKKWEKTYSKDNLNTAYSVIEADGGYVVAGRTEYSSLKRDGFLMKTDKKGNLGWLKTYDNDNRDEFRSVKKVSDGYVAAGETMNTEYETAAWMVKTDKKGKEKWNKTYGTAGESTLYSVLTEKDGYVVAGGKFNSGSEDGTWLMKVSKGGEVKWETFHGGQSAKSAIKTGDSYLLTAGSGEDDIKVVKTDKNGKEKWSEVYGGKKFDQAQSIISVDTGYVLGGATETKSTGVLDGWFMKLNPSIKREKSIPEAIAGEDSKISFSELQKAINYWATDKKVPEADKKIDFKTLQKLIKAWATDKKV